MRRGLGTRRVPLGLLAVVAGLAGLVAIGTATTPSGAGAPTTVTVPLVGATAVCPALRREDAEQLITRVSVGVVAPTGAAPAASAPPGSDGVVWSQPLGGTGAPSLLPLQVPGQVVAGLGTELTDNGLVVQARGTLAPGLQVEQLTRAPTGPRRGYEGLHCASPQTDTWFAGGSLGAGESATLVLANEDDTAAVVDLQVWSAEGPVDPRPGKGLVVPAGGRTAVPLDTLAPAHTGLALHLRAARGRVVAAVEHLRGGDGTPLGAEWVPPTSPAARVVVPGLPAGPGGRTLLVTNPGLDPTVVAVQLTAGDGQFVPAGLDAVPVPAGTTVPVDLTALLAGSPGAVTVTSAAGPVLAVGLVADGAGPTQDISYAGSAGPLDGPGLIPDLAGGAGVLLLTALAGDASVVVTPLPVLGVPPGAATPAPQAVPVAGGTTVGLPLVTFGVTGDGTLALQVGPAPGSGPVHAAVLLREDLPDGPLTTLLTLVAARQGAERPVVDADPGAALP